MNSRPARRPPRNPDAVYIKRKKVCSMCLNKQDHLDYKDTESLLKFISERGKILPRRVTGTCAKHQRVVSEAVKIARQVALLPYVSSYDLPSVRQSQAANKPNVNLSESDTISMVE
jgi:small subunit ribosomal protein S18